MSCSKTVDGFTVTLPVNGLIQRHLSIIGMTGCGKSYLVGLLCEELTRQKAAVLCGVAKIEGGLPLSAAEGVFLGLLAVDGHDDSGKFRALGPGHFASESGTSFPNELDDLRFARLQLEELPVEHRSDVKLAQSVHLLTAELILARRHRGQFEATAVPDGKRA